MAKATAAISRSLRRVARAVTFLPSSTYRFVRLLATRCRRGVRLSTAALAPASAKWRRRNRRHARPSPPRDVAPPAAEIEAAVAGKYWAQRHSLFSLYDRGVRMDAEGWYSATPEAIAATQASYAPPASVVIDAFAGVGGNSIQFAARGCYVVAVEIDPRKVELAAHNARIYGVEDRIEFVIGDFFHLAPSLKADLVFLSPPWGGPTYKKAQVYSLDMLKPKMGMRYSKLPRKYLPTSPCSCHGMWT
ncbi:hypothetical protein GUJ93_ZPchr0012g22213 [Zizania palustris]|uniref:Trimethylguanosine synthase n=1 Tax=Zizania palustris TaxID=103762 RepID=A0A8J5WV79_ZIZPA|nr:hypothetical protein GUJ93_ZPchr0012g22213 [Zizania palustris]